MNTKINGRTIDAFNRIPIALIFFNFSKSNLLLKSIIKKKKKAEKEKIFEKANLNKTGYFDNISLIEANNMAFNIFNVKTLNLLRRKIVSILIKNSYKELLLLIKAMIYKVSDDTLEHIVIKKEQVEKVLLFRWILKSNNNNFSRILLTVEIANNQKLADDMIRLQRDLIVASSSLKSLKDIVSCIFDYALKIEGIDSAGLYLRDLETGDLNLYSHRGLPKEFIETTSHFTADSDNVKLVMKGDPIHIHYSKLDVKFDKIEIKEGIKAISIIPIKYKNNVIGALNLASHSVYEISPASCNVIESIAGIIGSNIVRVQVESDFYESETRYSKLIDLVPDAIVIIQDGIYKFVNQAFTKMMGYTNKEITKGLSFMEVVQEKDKKIVMKRYKDRLAGKKLPKTFQVSLVSKSGKIIPCETSASLIEYNKKSADLVIARDISERKKLEKQKEQFEARIREVNKMRAIGQLAGGIAHDFNNQLAGIMGFADILRKELHYDKHLIEIADNIVTASKRASDLTSQLLAFARKGKYLSVPVDIHKIIRETISFIKHSINKKIIIKRLLNAGIPITNGDPAQLQNVFLNLALNAADAMKDGGEIIFSTNVVNFEKSNLKKSQFTNDPGKYIKICVKDTGAGMDDKTRERVFEPFFTTKKNKGLGMGLAAVYGTIRNHNGLIDVKSEIEKGTSVEVYLKCGNVVKLKPKIKKSSRMVSINKSVHIFLVDDEELVCDLITKIVKKVGFHITSCRSGRAAVNKYKKIWKDIDLVILDMVMPKMNGHDVYLEMRKINPDIVALLSSGYSMTSETQKMMKEGIKGFIQKPFIIDNFMNKIARYLKKVPPGKKHS